MTLCGDDALTRRRDSRRRIARDYFLFRNSVIAARVWGISWSRSIIGLPIHNTLIHLDNRIRRRRTDVEKNPDQIYHHDGRRRNLSGGVAAARANGVSRPGAVPRRAGIFREEEQARARRELLRLPHREEQQDARRVA